MTIMNMNDTTPVIISELLKSTFDFYITGSRFWGNITCHSDWDFFVQESPEVMSYLVNLGFTSDPAHQYHDPLTITVMRNCMIHIQVVHDAALKNLIQQSLYKYFPQGMIPSYWSDCPKKFAAVMWDLAFDLLGVKPRHSKIVLPFSMNWSEEPEIISQVS